MERLFQAFIEQPLAKNLLALRRALLADSLDSVAPADLRKLHRWVESGNSQAAIIAAERLPDAAAMSPRVHFLMAQAALQTGDRESLEMEQMLFQATLKGILATGDGSYASPYLICQPSDEYDVLLTLGYTPVRQVCTVLDSLDGASKDHSAGTGGNSTLDKVICKRNKPENGRAISQLGAIPRILEVDAESTWADCAPDEVEVWFDLAAFVPKAVLGRLQPSDLLAEISPAAKAVTKRVRKDTAEHSVSRRKKNASLHVYKPTSTVVKRRAKASRTPR
ncbi:MAG: hypothetical protein ACO1RA_19635 [Planctomycetaceae bacterium]